jgi:hypothetical protein
MRQRFGLDRFDFFVVRNEEFISFPFLNQDVACFLRVLKTCNLCG